MTRIVGTRLVSTPCCNAVFAMPAYGSINFSAQEFWTDGPTFQSLFNNDGGLRRCTCGAYYRLSETEDVEMIPKPRPSPPQGWEEEADSWLWKLKSKPSRAVILSSYDTRAVEVINAEEQKTSNRTIHVKDTELQAALDGPPVNIEVELIIRRRLWQFLNDAYREIYRKHKADLLENQPDFEPTKLEIDNMLRMVVMVEDSKNPTHLELAELHRQLGDAAQSRAAIVRAGKSAGKLGQTIGMRLDLGIRGPARYRLN